MRRGVARTGAGVVAGAALMGLAGCGGGFSAAPLKVRPRPHLGPYLRVSPSRRQVWLTVVAGATTGGFDLDGTENGHLRVVVPRGFVVHVRLVNHSRLANSLAVLTPSGTLAFPGAYAPAQALSGRGVPQGRSASFAFVARTVGTYRLASLVPGHMESGMWAVLQVVAQGRPHLSLGPPPREVRP
jgi:hypothetical protein